MRLRFWTIFLAAGLATGVVVVAHWMTSVTTVATPTAVASETPWRLEYQPAATSPWTLTAVGDIMLDRHVRTTIQQHGPYFPFESIRQQLEGDVVLGNLEGPLTDHASVATDTHLVFTFDEGLAAVLKDVGFTHLSLANNHSRNFGQAGLDNTRRVLQAAGLNYFGDPLNRPGYDLVTTESGQSVAFIGYLGLTAGLETVLDQIRQAETRGDYTIVMTHWGSEYQLGISVKAQRQAHQLIEAGADLILGAHPHVVEPFEIYHGKLIAYSLGNFLFDQYFSEDTLQGLLLRLRFNPETIDLELVPIRTTDRQVERLAGPARQSMLDRLARDSIVDERLREGIRTGKLTIVR